MHIEFTHCRTAAYWRRQLRAGSRQVATWGVVSGCALALAGGLTIVVLRGDGILTVAGIIAMVAAIVMLVRIRPIYLAETTAPAGWSAPRTWVITDHGLETRSDLTSTFWSWRAVCHVQVSRDAYVFRQDGPIAFDVPRAPLGADQEATLRAFLTGRGLLPTS